MKNLLSDRFLKALLRNGCASKLWITSARPGSKKQGRSLNDILLVPKAIALGKAHLNSVRPHGLSQ